MDEFFGKNPARPSHPDFWKLSDIVLRLDGAMQERGDTPVDEIISELASEMGDSYSITYMATQRAMRVVGITQAYEVMEKQEEIAQYAMMYLEGMLVGHAFTKRNEDEEEPT